MLKPVRHSTNREATERLVSTPGMASRAIASNPPPQSSAAGTAHTLAINGHHALHLACHVLKPLPTSFFQLPGVQEAKHPGKGVVGGNPSGKIHKACEPVLVGLGKLRHIYPVICTRDGGAQCDVRVDRGRFEGAPADSRIDSRVKALECLTDSLSFLDAISMHKPQVAMLFIADVCENVDPMLDGNSLGRRSGYRLGRRKLSAHNVLAQSPKFAWRPGSRQVDRI